VEHDKLEQINLRLIRIWLKSNEAVYDQIVGDIKRHGLSVENFMILELLYNKGPQTIQKISERLTIPSGSITYVVNRLAKKDYVKREACPADRRSSYVVLTDQGEALFQKIFPEHVELLNALLEPLTSQEKETLAELLKKLGYHAAQLRF